MYDASDAGVDGETLKVSEILWINFLLLQPLACTLLEILGKEVSK